MTDKTNLNERFARVPVSVIAALSGPALKVWSALASFADDKGVARPGRKRIAEVAGLAPVTVERHLRALADEGHLTRRERFGRRGQQLSNEYTLTALVPAPVGDLDSEDPLVLVDPPEPSDEGEGTSGSRPPTCASVRGGGADPDEVTHDRPRLTIVKPEPGSVMTWEADQTARAAESAADIVARVKGFADSQGHAL